MITGATGAVVSLRTEAVASADGRPFGPVWLTVTGTEAASGIPVTLSGILNVPPAEHTPVPVTALVPVPIVTLTVLPATQVPVTG